MELTGKIIIVGDLQQGVSKAGKEWQKRQYVLETQEGSFPRKVAFTAFGQDRVAQFDAVCLPGAMVKLSYDIDSREYQGRWYTDISGWKVEPAGNAATAAAPAAPTPGTYSAPVAPVAAQAPQGAYVPPTPANNDIDDLPF